MFRVVFNLVIFAITFVLVEGLIPTHFDQQDWLLGALIWSLVTIYFLVEDNRRSKDLFGRRR